MVTRTGFSGKMKKISSKFEAVTPKPKKKKKKSNKRKPTPVKQIQKKRRKITKQRDLGNTDAIDVGKNEDVGENEIDEDEDEIDENEDESDEEDKLEENSKNFTSFNIFDFDDNGNFIVDEEIL